MPRRLWTGSRPTRITPGRRQCCHHCSRFEPIHYHQYPLATLRPRFVKIRRRRQPLLTSRRLSKSRLPPPSSVMLCTMRRLTSRCLCRRHLRRVRQAGYRNQAPVRIQSSESNCQEAQPARFRPWQNRRPSRMRQPSSSRTNGQHRWRIRKRRRTTRRLLQLCQNRQCRQLGTRPLSRGRRPRHRRRRQFLSSRRKPRRHGQQCPSGLLRCLARQFPLRSSRSHGSLRRSGRRSSRRWRRRPRRHRDSCPNPRR